MRYLKQSTAVDLPIGPFVDSAGAAATGLTLTQPDIRLKKEGGNWAQKSAAQTLSHEENGYYEVALSTTDTDTLGRMRLAVNETGALPVWEDFMVVAANIYDSLFGGGDVLDVSVTQFGGSNLTQSGGRPEVNVSHLGGSAVSQSSGLINANVTQISGDATAADNLEAAADGGSYNLGGGGIVAASVTTKTGYELADGAITAAKIASDAITAAKIADGAIDAATFAAGAINAAAIASDAITDAKVASDVTIASVTGSVGSVTGAVGSVTGNVGGNVTGSVGSITSGGIAAASFAAGAITASAIAADAIGASELAADAVAEIQSGLATSAALATVDTVVDAIKVTTDKLDDTLEDNAGTFRFTESALAEGPGGGGGGGTDWSADERTAIRSILGIPGSGTTPADPSAGILDTIRDSVATRASQTSVDDLPTNAELATALGTADDAVLAAIAALNNLSQANIRTAIGLSTANLDTQLADLPTNAELATALASADDAVLAAIAALNNLSQANIRTAVGLGSANLDTQLAAIDDAVDTEVGSIITTLATISGYLDTEIAAIKAVTDQFTAAQAEPTGVPAANATPLAKLAWLAAMARNRITQTATQQLLKADDGTTTIGTSTVSDDGTTFVRGEFA